jgi:hypothetical protein
MVLNLMNPDISLLMKVLNGDLIWMILRMVLRMMTPNFPLILMQCSGRLRNDYDTVLLAVNTDGNALGCASREMRANKSIVLAAVRKGQQVDEEELPSFMAVGGPLHYADPDLKLDREVVCAAVEHMRQASDEVQESNVNAELASLQSMHTELVKHWMKSVDNAMCRGNEFTGMLIR